MTKFVQLPPHEYYQLKGLKRVQVTLTEGSINFLDDKRKQFSELKVTKAGDIVDAMIDVYLENPEFAALVDKRVVKLLEEKVVRKNGRKEGWRKESEED